MDLEIVRSAVKYLDDDEDFALATIIHTSGSSPRHGGTSMLVRTDGGIVGTIGGGALEARAIQEALSVLQTRSIRLMHFVLTPEDSAGLGMICGGQGAVLIEPMASSHASAREFWQSLARLLDEGGKGWLVTSITGSQEEGWSVTRVIAGSRDAVPDQPPTREGGPLVHVHPVGMDGTAYVFGAGHCGAKLIPALDIAGFRTVIIDDRADFANRGRFPTADEVVVLDSLESGVDGLGIDGDSYVVIVTRGHVFDQAVLAQALRTDACYIGMIGSRKKVAAIFDALRAQGFSDADIERVHAPIGLPIGGETPGEIAISIAAQLVQTRAKVRGL
jgi:xanthine dehydrogenase accessory factor